MTVKFTSSICNVKKFAIYDISL